MPASPARRLVLASTSRYRRALLERLGVPFTVASPEVDETAAPGEMPAALAPRLAEAKARAVGQAFPDAVIVGSDQVADLDGAALGKPGGAAAARAQLRRMSGRAVVFRTALCVLDMRDGRCRLASVDVTSRFRTLSDREIDRYLAAEKPFDCAGSVKSEALGITLFDAIESDDPTALVGLPLIALARFLREAGFELP